MVIRLLVIGLLVFAASCGGNPSIEDVCGDCEEETTLDACEEGFMACEELPLQRVRDACFATLGFPCDVDQ